MMRALFFLIFISNNSFSQIKDSHVPVRHINKTIKEVIYENHFIEDREIYKVEMQIKKFAKNTDELSNAYYCLADVLLKQANYSDAVFMFKKVDSLTILTNNDGDRIMANMFLAATYNKLMLVKQSEERFAIAEKLIKKLNIPSEKVDNRISKNILKHFDKYAEKFTNKLFEYNMLTHTEEFLSEEEFREQYKSIVNEKSFHKIFNSYYDFKNPIFENLENETSTLDEVKAQDFFSDEKVSLVFEKNALENDAKVLEMIQNGTYKLKTFDYDGAKYTKSQTPKVLKILKQREEQVDQKIKENDDAIL